MKRRRECLKYNCIDVDVMYIYMCVTAVWMAKEIGMCVCI